VRYGGEQFLAVDIKSRRSNPKVKRTRSRSIVRTRQNSQSFLGLALTDSTCHVEPSRSQHRILISDTRSLSLGRLQTSMLDSLKLVSKKTLSRASIVSLFDLSFRLVLLMEACGRLWYYGIERSQIRELNLNFHILRRTSRMLLSRACLKGQSRVSSTGWIRYSLCLRDETMIQSDAVFRTNFALWKKHFSRTDNDEGEGLAQIIERNVTQIRVGEKQARELSSIKRESK